MEEKNYMEQALDEAFAASARGEVPVGAVIVDGATGEVVASAGNRVEELSDPTAHAEVLAIRKAAIARSSPRLEGCDLYVTLEPCPMCATAISFARIRRIYFGAYDPKGGESIMVHGFFISRPVIISRRSTAVSASRRRRAC